MKNIIFLDGIFDQDTILSFPSHSVATNTWLNRFANSLNKCGFIVSVTGFPEERIWPFGRFIVSRANVKIANNLSGTSASYLNIPIIRPYSKKIALKKSVNQMITKSGAIPKYAVTFSCLNKSGYTLPSFEVAKFLRNKYGTNWICIVGDGPAPIGANFYLYHNWTNFLKHPPEQGSAIHLDGGVDDLSFSCLDPNNDHVKTFLYSGALSIHGGVNELVDEFSKVRNKSCELWITGRGASSEFIQRASQDKRIKILGFLSDDELINIAEKVNFFINPRLSSFAPNLDNFPSKLFFYLTFEKPILSTFTPGISPEYKDVLIRLSETDMANDIEAALDLSDHEIKLISKNIRKFKYDHSWDSQCRKFYNFLHTNT